MLTEKIQLEEDETILMQVRKHWFILLTQLLGAVGVALLPLVLIPLVLVSPLAPFIPIATYSVLVVSIYAGWLIISWMLLFGIWTNYYLDVWTVTNKRLITVDQRGLFHRDTGSFRLERLQDINVSIRGILATFLKFGDLQAETASGDRDFVARGIPNPQELKALILESADKITYTKPHDAGTGEGM